MDSLRITILRLFNVVDPTGLFELTGLADEYLPEVDDLLNIIRTNPPHDATALISQVHKVLKDNFHSGCAVGAFLLDDPELDDPTESLSIREKPRRPPKFNTTASRHERLLGRMIWKSLHETD